MSQQKFNEMTLNSNLILLIRRWWNIHQVSCTSLNSNLILLIRFAVRWIDDCCFVFKFQSDSINTDRAVKYITASLSFKFQSDSINTNFYRLSTRSRKTLNSNLILLIRCSKRRNRRRTASFKFQSDSINTRVQRHL